MVIFGLVLQYSNELFTLVCPISSFDHNFEHLDQLWVEFSILLKYFRPEHSLYTFDQEWQIGLF